MASGISVRRAGGLTRDFGRYAGNRAIIGLVLALAGSGVEAIGLLSLAALLRIVLAPHPEASLPAELAWLADGRSIDTRLFLALAFFALLMLVRAAVLSVRDDYLGRLQFGYVESAKTRLLDAVAAAPYGAISRVPPGHVSQAISGEINDLGIAANSLMTSASAAATLAAMGVLACALSPSLALTALLGAVALVAMLPLARHVSRLGLRLRQHRRDTAEQMLRFLAGLKPAKAQGIDRPVVEQLQAASAQVIDLQIAFLRVQSMTRNLWSTLAMLVALACTGAGLFLWRIEPAIILAFLLLASRISGAAIVLHQGVHQVLECSSALEHLQELEVRLAGSPGAVPAVVVAASPLPRGLSLRGVTYLHRADDGVVELSVDIPEGAFVGVSGVSGAGKTSFIDLVAGLLVPQQGTVFRNGVPLIGAALDLHREALAYVTQDAALFGATLRDGFRLANAQAGPEDVESALALVGADALIRRVPDALDLPLLGRDAFMSSGERQRLALACAVLRRPSLLILDEATNALDMASEARVLAALARLDPRPTILLISHRPHALAPCEHVLRFEAGRLLAELPSAGQLMELLDGA
jgi:ATP-binding cassette, subfamily C, bacterial